MSLIDGLKEEKAFIFEYAKRNNSSEFFSYINKDSESYWIKYESSNHCGEPLSVYNSEDIREMRSVMGDCLKDDRELLGTIISAVQRSERCGDSSVPKVDLHNYMM